MTEAAMVSPVKVPIKSIITAIILVAGGALAVLNSTILTPILPVLMGEMNVEATTVQWLASLFMLVNAITVPMTAYFMGRFSTNRIFIASMMFLGVGSIICALAPSFPFLLAGRAVQAVSSGILMPLVVTVLMLLFPAEKRGVVMGVYSLAICAAPAIGPVVIGILADTIGWRLVFVATAVLALLFLVMGNFLIQKNVAGRPSNLDGASIALSSLSLLALLYGFSSMTSGNKIVCAALIIIGIVGLFFFSKRQLKMETPYLDIKVLGYKNFTIGTIVSGLANAVLTILTVILPLYLQNACGVSATESGLVIAPVALGASLVSIIAGRLHDTLGARTAAIGGAIIMAAAALGLMMFTCSTPIILVGVVATLIGVGAMATVVPMNTWSINALPNDLISHGNAVGSTLRQVMSSLGTAIAVAVMAFGSSLSSAALSTEVVLAGALVSFGFLAVLAVLAFVIALFMVKNPE